MTDPLLAVDGLHTQLPTEDGLVKAVDGVSFEVDHGETVCLVGESGSGKTLTCDSITGLVPHQHADTFGTVTFDGQNLIAQDDESMRSIRGNRIAYVFQNAQSALDPVYTIGDQIVEAMAFHRSVSDEEGRERAIELLQTVGLSRPEERVDQYPHEFSDGMCQRAAIAIGLASEPDLLIADEPTSALDVTIQARIIDLLRRIQDEQDLALMLVTHDLRVVSALADRVVVLYDGTVVERGSLESIFDAPGHPYTQSLLRSFTGDREQSAITTVDTPAGGCRYRVECPHAIDACADGQPPFNRVDGTDGHEAACVFHAPGHDATTVMAEAPELGGSVDDADDGGKTDD